MPYFHLVDYIPWLGSTITQCLLLGIMLQRSSIRRFPIFLSSIVFDLVREMALPVVAYHSALAYGYGYWLSIPLEDMIGLAVIMEVYRYSRGADPEIPNKILQLLLLATLALMSLAIFLILHPDISTRNFSGLVLTLNRSVDLMRCGMLLFLWLFASRLGISWRHHVAGIVIGLGIYSAAELTVSTIHATTGVASGDWLARLPHFGYFAATIVWTVYLGRPEPAREPLTLQELSLARHLIERYRRMLEQLWRLFVNGTTD